MRTVLHLTGGDDGWGHAIRSAALLFGHDGLPHEDVTLLPTGRGSDWSCRGLRARARFVT